MEPSHDHDRASGGESGPWAIMGVRIVLFIARTLRGEWHSMVVEPVRQLMRRGLSGLLLAFVAAFGVIFFHAIAQRPTGEMAVRVMGGVKADLPLWLALLRTPVSLYVPALDLPVWAGITQLFLAFALAELMLGRARTLALSYATTLAGTLTVRVMIAIGPGWAGLGLPPEAGQVLDTGPSAAVVGLFTYLAVIRRAPVVFTLTGGSMVLESIFKPNLAGREHLIAVGAAIVLGLLHGSGSRLRRAWAVLLTRRGALRVSGTRPPAAAPVPAARAASSVPPSAYGPTAQGPARHGERVPARDAAPIEPGRTGSAATSRSARSSVDFAGPTDDASW
ncbi:hypothetical protein [Streptomyces colonosanans]|uniref:hypothetical protein n=1 Tax=Streptomyces colonosanans TaxID=1428652 RepID=UPI001FE2DB60|nr:hypothetical protein [Streptomyces colonosanans]